MLALWRFDNKPPAESLSTLCIFVVNVPALRRLARLKIEAKRLRATPSLTPIELASTLRSGFAAGASMRGANTNSSCAVLAHRLADCCA